MKKEMLILYYTDRCDFNTPCCILFVSLVESSAIHLHLTISRHESLSLRNASPSLLSLKDFSVLLPSMLLCTVFFP